MKQAKDSSWLASKEFQLRYFFLDLSQGVLKYAKQPNQPMTILNFREINSMEVDPLVKSGSTMDRNYPFCFKLNMVKRELVLAAKTLSDRQTWINGINVLFEFREYQNRKLSVIMPGGMQPGANEKKIGQLRSQSQSLPDRGGKSISDKISSFF